MLFLSTYIDFQKIAQQVQEFLGKLACEEGTADLRDALNLALLYTQRYYKTLRSRSHSNTMSPSSEHRSLSGTLLFTNSCGAVSPVSPACGMQNQFEWKWYNLDSPKLSASLGTSEFSSISPFLQAAKTGDVEGLKSLIDEGKTKDFSLFVYYHKILLKIFARFVDLKSLKIVQTDLIFISYVRCNCIKRASIYFIFTYR